MLIHVFTQEQLPMLDFSLNAQPAITKIFIGEEQTPLLIIDDFAMNPEDIIAYAGDGASFKADPKNFYPGKRKLVPRQYSEQICQRYLRVFRQYFGFKQAKKAKFAGSALAIVGTPVDELRPIQMLPHIDTPQSNQFALVHYLCSPEHGGRAFYRHKRTGYEAITQERLYKYASQVKKEAIANQLHKAPSYMNGSNSMFEQLYSVEASMNRAVIYPSNLLHSGNINPLLLSPSPHKGRLTISSFIIVE